MKRELLIETAKNFIGVKEFQDNDGAVVEMFQKAVDGVASKEAWCAGFTMYCLNRVQEITNIKDCVFRTESVIECWQRSPFTARKEEPEPGDIVLWWFFKDGQPTMKGHMGIVTEVNADTFKTVEGNTSDGQGIVREGDGVYERTRTFKGSATFQLLGFLDPWVIIKP